MWCRFLRGFLHAVSASIFRTRGQGGKCPPTCDTDSGCPPVIDSSSAGLGARAVGDCFVVASISEESALLRRFSMGEETEDVFRRLRPAGAYLSNDRRLFLSPLGPGLRLISLFLPFVRGPGLLLLSLSSSSLALLFLPALLGFALRLRLRLVLGL